MTSYPLRPVQLQDPSPSPSPSATPPGDRPTPPYDQRGHPRNQAPHPMPSMSRTRRPLSPSSLRDVNLTRDNEIQPGRYPPPPTGHELMAMFPPKAPATFPETGPTSAYFARQERAFFAHGGKEIIRVRVDIDMDPRADGIIHNGKGKGRDTGDGVPNPSWPAQQQQHGPMPPQTRPPPGAPLPYPSLNSRQPRGHSGAPNSLVPMNVYPQQQPHHPPQSLPPPPQPHPTPAHPAHDMRSPPHDARMAPPPDARMAPPADYSPEEFRDDEAWRRPMPYAERRRAGKHTRRVVVRN